MSKITFCDFYQTGVKITLTSFSTGPPEHGVWGPQERFVPGVKPEEPRFGSQATPLSPSPPLGNTSPLHAEDSICRRRQATHRLDLLEAPEG